MLKLVGFLNGIIWSKALIYLCLGTGVYFSIKMRFLQVRHFKHMFNLLVGEKGSDKGVSSFQALAISVSGRVGTGNIAGVATAIALGGPGSIFWMWTIAFLGAGSAFVESALAQVYKKEHNGEYRGGPAYYIEKGLGINWYAMLFAIATFIALGMLLPGTQSNSIALAMENAYGINPYISGAVLIVAFAMVIFGGVKRIGKVAEIVAPFMATGYIIVALLIIFMNITKLPAVIALIFKSAFAVHPVFGGIIGMAISWGVKRGIFSNEAGQGTGAHPAAAAEVSHPAKQGLVQAFSVYIDTLFVCSATAFMILITGMYNVENSAGGFLVNNLPGVGIGPEYTQLAVESVFPAFGSGFVAISLSLFAFTSLLAFYYNAETNAVYLEEKLNVKGLVMALRVIIVAATFYGAIKTATLAWGLADIGVGMMAWINIIAILLLRKPAFKVLKDYESQLKAGKEPVFDPVELGIENAEFWISAKPSEEKTAE
ncbi:alanine or glycine:cation symporter, AGCS family [Peptoclostridium litorale DSM 5388]|uniref:Amino acid carrier protein n=1 Tax=Peptoclostridium litorale DSM 5388 TaxID=1121324 RepID=A0A069RDB9_PEPLI|nr:alanine/glycine:cation symporter family protein [Peptoclostridium litorale]KDR94220.1 amino acid carrier protein [Peptoclostridium litorale DSM 5388]SIN82479.1 alanine or glycine:cation symporter, AGCS family [Peptoclostridium litorale DSM 5388]